MTPAESHESAATTMITFKCNLLILILLHAPLVGSTSAVCEPSPNIFSLLTPSTAIPREAGPLADAILADTDLKRVLKKVSAFVNPQMEPYHYQNGGDWTWFGARIVAEMARRGYAGLAYRELRPMMERVLENDGFFEWYGIDNQPHGSSSFKGSAGVLADAIGALMAWAEGVHACGGGYDPDDPYPESDGQPMAENTR